MTCIHFCSLDLKSCAILMEKNTNFGILPTLRLARHPEMNFQKSFLKKCGDVALLSKNYFTSQFCKHIELPFLMWRWERHKLLCLPVKVGVVPIEKVRLPKYDGVSRRINLNEIIDDRQAAMDFSNSVHRE